MLRSLLLLVVLVVLLATLLVMTGWTVWQSRQQRHAKRAAQHHRLLLAHQLQAAHQAELEQLTGRAYIISLLNHLERFAATRSYTSLADLLAQLGVDPALRSATEALIHDQSAETDPDKIALQLQAKCRHFFDTANV